jgi:hemerythrin
MSIIWDSAYETGHATIDAQHRELLGIVNGLESAQTEASDSGDAVLGVLSHIMDYSLSHFAMEEELMAEVGYPTAAFEEMVQQHQEFTSNARMCAVEFGRGELVSMLPLQSFLTAWLLEHVIELDKRLAEFIREQSSTSAQVDGAR